MMDTIHGNWTLVEKKDGRETARGRERERKHSRQAVRTLASFHFPSFKILRAQFLPGDPMTPPPG